MVFFSDKFDQFWAVNRRLMDVASTSQVRSSSPATTSNTSDTKSDDSAGRNFQTFKHIPVKFYKKDTLLSLKLVKPIRTCDNGQERLSTLQDLIEEYFNPEKDLKPGKSHNQTYIQLITRGKEK